ncbi:MAG: chorismate pyruvate-lyase family protein [Alphaproteobacteria bacterium]
MSAIDILGKLKDSEIATLDPLQRILLITDGTLTEILEAAHLEPIRLIKIAQERIPATAAHASLAPAPQENMLTRKILLQGARSGTCYVYAESVIAVERLSPAFQDELLNSDIPLGRLWIKHRLETFKEAPTFDRHPGNDLGDYFAYTEPASILARSYRVFSAAKPVMLITEYFPIKK